MVNNSGMPPKQRKTKTPASGDRRKSVSADSGQPPAVKRRRSQRRSVNVQDDETDERLSVALTMAALADSFNSERCLSSDIHLKRSRRGNGSTTENGMGHGRDSSELVSVEAGRMLPVLRNGTQEPVSGFNNTKAMNYGGKSNKSRNSMSSTDYLEVSRLPSQSSGSVVNSKDVPVKRLPSRAEKGKTKKKKKKRAGSNGVEGQVVEKVIEILPAVIDDVHSVVSEADLSSKVALLPPDRQLTLPAPPVLSTSNNANGVSNHDILKLPLIFTTIPMLDGTLRLVPIQDLSFQQSLMSQLSSNSLSTSGAMLVSQQLQPLFAPINIKNALPTSGQVSACESQQFLGSLDSLRKFYQQPDSTEKVNQTVSTASGLCNQVSKLEYGNDKVPVVDKDLSCVESLAKNRCVETQPGHKSSIPGSLSAIRDFYNGIKRKDKPVDSSKSSPSVMSVCGVVGSISSIAAHPTLLIDISQASTGQSTRPSPSSTSRILPLPRAKSLVFCPQTNTVLTSEKLSTGTGDLSRGIDGGNLSELIASTVSGANLRTSPAIDSSQPSSLKKKKNAPKTGNATSKDCSSGNMLLANGTEGSDMEKNGEPAIIENRVCSPAEDSAGCKQLTSPSNIQVQNVSTASNVGLIATQLLSNRSVLDVDEDGDLPLHIAIVNCEFEFVNQILPAMSQMNSSVDQYNNLRQTPLHLAVVTGQTAIVQSLLEFGASPNCPDREGLNCLHLAVSYGRLDCLNLLLTSNKTTVDINAMNYEGLAPLHLAVKLDRQDCVEVLVKAGANVNMQDGKSGHSPLYLAAMLNRLSIASILLSHKASVQLGSYYGCTPIQAASARAHHSFVKLLLQNGAVETSSDKVKQEANETGQRRVRQKISRQSSVVDNHAGTTERQEATPV